MTCTAGYQVATDDYPVAYLSERSHNSRRWQVFGFSYIFKCYVGEAELPSQIFANVQLELPLNVVLRVLSCPTTGDAS